MKMNQNHDDERLSDEWNQTNLFEVMPVGPDLRCGCGVEGLRM